MVFDSGRSNLPHGHQFSTAPSRGRKRAELNPSEVLSSLHLPPPNPISLSSHSPFSNSFLLGLKPRAAWTCSGPPGCSVTVTASSSVVDDSFSSNLGGGHLGSVNLSQTSRISPSDACSSSPTVDVHRPSGSVPDDVRCSGPIRGRGRGRSSQWRRPMIKGLDVL